MKKVLSMVTVAGLALTAAASVHAQVASSIVGSGDIKVGIFDPNNQDDRNYGGSSQLSIGADYSPPGVPGTQRPTIYGDFEGGSKNHGHVDTYGIGIATKYTQSTVGSLTKITPYYGLGVGLYRINVNNLANGESGTTTTFGGKAFVGVTFSKWIVEANYQVLPSVKGVNPGGIGLQVGMTF